MHIDRIDSSTAHLVSFCAGLHDFGKTLVASPASHGMLSICAGSQRGRAKTTTECHDTSNVGAMRRSQASSVVDVLAVSGGARGQLLTSLGGCADELIASAAILLLLLSPGSRLRRQTPGCPNDRFHTQDHRLTPSFYIERAALHSRTSASARDLLTGHGSDLPDLQRHVWAEQDHHCRRQQWEDHGSAERPPLRDEQTRLPTPTHAIHVQHF